jgi:hypothetical protein
MGRDMEENDLMPPSWKFAREICVPRVHDGILQYILMDLVASGELGSDWILREKKPQGPLPPVLAMNDLPDPILPPAGMGSMRY